MLMQHLQLTVPPSRILANCIEITGVRGIGRTRSQSLGGEFGSLFWIDMWEYHRAFGRHDAFVKGLVDESVYDTPEQDRLAALTTVRDGSFSCTPTRVRRLQPGPRLRAVPRDTSTTRASYTLPN